MAAKFRYKSGTKSRSGSALVVVGVILVLAVVSLPHRPYASILRMLSIRLPGQVRLLA